MGDRLRPGDKLEPGQKIQSNNKKFALVIWRNRRVKLYRIEPDDLVPMGRISGYRVPENGWLGVTANGYLGGMFERNERILASWARPRNGIGPSYLDPELILQDDGNLVLYGSLPRRGAPAVRGAQWASGTYGEHRRAVNPDHTLIQITNGSLAIEANTIIELGRTEQVTVFDGEQSRELRRGESVGVRVPNGSGALQIKATEIAPNFSEGTADAVGRYLPESILERSGNTWTIKPRRHWLIDPAGGGNPAPEAIDAFWEEYDLPEIDQGFTDDDLARVEGSLPPLDFTSGEESK